MKRKLLAWVLLAAAAQVHAQIEKRDVHIAVGGKTALYYLPLTLTERLGFFKDEGLNVRISDFAGGTRSLEAVVGGSADVVAGAYEHTINMQARKQSFQAFVLAGASPQISVGIATSRAASYKSPRDLKGLKVGVSAPGSSTNMVINYVLAKGPEEYLLGNKAMYLFAYNNVKTAYSKDGYFSDAGAKTTLKALASFNPAVKPDAIDLAQTYTNEFVKKAHAKYGKKK